MTKPRVLVCDDEPAARRGLVRSLGGASFELLECGNGAEALELLAEQNVDLLLLDLRMPVMDGMTTLGKLSEMPSPPPVIVLTADASLDTAIAAVKAGATDFVAKPYDIDALRHVVRKTLEQTRLANRARRLEEEVERWRGPSPLVGRSAAILGLLEVVERVAPTAASVLITGESGTGKELVARLLHERSQVKEGPLVTVNCSAIPNDLVESELFGHRRGAFTGADLDRAGKFQEADRGTLFLDEIGDMALSAQAKLLRILQESEVQPLGSGASVRVDVRVVAATNRDLTKRVSEGSFREDLLFRLRVVEIPMPPLRERGDDVVLLARHFLETFGRGKLTLSPETETSLESHRWPGNVRELRNAIARASIFCRDGVVRPEDLPREVGGVETTSSGTAPYSWTKGDDFQTAKQKVIERFERDSLGAALEEHGGNISRAAKALGLHRQNLQQKLKQLGISAEDFRR